MSSEPKPTDTEAKSEENKEGAETDTETKTGDSDGKCSDQSKSCHGKSLADSLRGLDNIGDKIDEKLKNVQNNLVNGVKNAAKGQLKCGADMAKSIPNAITNIGKSYAGAINNVAGSVKNVYNELNGHTLVGFPNIGGPFQTAYLMMVNKLQKTINKLALGKDAEAIVEDSNMNPHVLLEEVSKNSAMYNLIMADPEFKLFFGKWMKDYADALVSALDAADPAINKMTDKFNNLINDVSVKTGDTIGNSLSNVLKSMISAVPGAGALISGAATFAKMGNQITEICETAVPKVAGIGLPIANAVTDQINLTKCKANEFKKPLDKVMSKISGGAGTRGKIYNKTKNKYNKTKEKTIKYNNKRYISKKVKPNYINEKINNSTLRIKKMLNNLKRNHTHRLK